MEHNQASKDVAIVGAGPAGLFAAGRIADAGHRVTVFDHMPSPARKFLMAGRGGLNLTHSEPLETFLSRYAGGAAKDVRDAVAAFPPAALMAWANMHGAKTFVGSSGRVFPKAMKASPLLRTWLRQLDERGVSFHFRHRWIGFADRGGLRFETPDGNGIEVHPDATLFALGGASWPRLGSDAAWVAPFAAAGVAITELAPANCGVTIPWSNHFKDTHAGAPLKRIAVTCAGISKRGEAIVTASGLEGGVVYALVPEIRKTLEANGTATITLDLKPDSTVGDLAARLARPSPGQSLSNRLRKATGLTPAALNLLREGPPLPSEPAALATRIKAVDLTVEALAGIARAISTAGGIAPAALTKDFELKARPGTFVAGEMLDWEAPTGGYLLQGVFATAEAAAQGLLRHLEKT